MKLNNSWLKSLILEYPQNKNFVISTAISAIQKKNGGDVLNAISILVEDYEVDPLEIFKTLMNVHPSSYSEEEVAFLLKKTGYSFLKAVSFLKEEAKCNALDLLRLLKKVFNPSLEDLLRVGIRFDLGYVSKLNFCIVFNKDHSDKQFDTKFHAAWNKVSKEWDLEIKQHGETQKAVESFLGKLINQRIISDCEE
ncbi:MAG: hypothetical protein ACP5OG_03035 [Candidatus Nanoarchaeia archaeon]